LFDEYNNLLLFFVERNNSPSLSFKIFFDVTLLFEIFFDDKLLLKENILLKYGL
jgi:hypothetical protein